MLNDKRYGLKIAAFRVAKLLGKKPPINNLQMLKSFVLTFRSKMA